MNCYQELVERGLIYQQTDAAAIEQLLNKDHAAYYCGFDPTGSSLHVGHLLPIMAMRMLQKHGHTPIVLVGGATGLIGDPSGRIALRPVLTKEDVEANVEAIRKQLARFINVEDGKAYFVNNIEWFEKLNYIDFLRDVGSKFSVNRMIAQESVKSRLEVGLTFIEFNYSIMQGYDFLELYRRYNCRLEIGGQDQWGNMVAGVELVRRSESKEVYASTIPLLMDSNGQKFGKTSGGNNVWLDVNRTSVFEYYQFWRNCDDAQARQLLMYFSPLPVAEIIDLTSDLQNMVKLNRAKEILAYEATCLAHGEEEALKAFLSAGAKFGFADPNNTVNTSSQIAQIDIKQAAMAVLPTIEVAASEFEGDGVWICRLLVDAGLCKSTGESRRLIQGGGAYYNDERISDAGWNIKSGDISEGAFVLKAGKKNLKRVVVK